jgi:hypothetical protein
MSGYLVQGGVTPDNSVSTAKIQDDAVTLAKLAAGTDGNIISFDASGNPVAIATGSDGEVLTSAGAGQPPAFEAAAGGGAWTLIGSQEASTSSSLTQTGLDSTYRMYAIVVAQIIVSNDGAYIKFRTGAGSIDSGGSDYKWVQIKNRAGSSGVSGGSSTGADHIQIDTDGGTGTGENISMMMFFNRPSSTSYPTLSVTAGMYNSNGDSLNLVTAGARVSAIAADRIQILPTAGTFTSGRLSVYGISHA